MANIIKEVHTNNYSYYIYDTGIIKQVFRFYDNCSENKIDFPINFADTTFNKTFIKLPEYTLNETITKEVTVFEKSKITITLAPVSKTAKMLGYVPTGISSYKGPTKSVKVENAQVDPGVGTGTGVVNEINLRVGINQYVTLKVDIPNAKVNNIPSGFKFVNNELVGAVKNPGEYKFNIVSETVSLPVTLIATNVIRIS